MVGHFEIMLGSEIVAEARDDRCDFRTLPGQRTVTIQVTRRVFGGQHRVELVQTKRELVELGVQREFHL